LDLKPDVIVDSKGRKHTKTALRRWGPPSCFFEDDLYTTRFGHWESTEIEQKFFGKIDNNGRKAVEYFADFQHPSADKDALYALLPYMSVQKLRTPKGLDNLAGEMKLGGNFVDGQNFGFHMKPLRFLALKKIQERNESTSKFTTHHNILQKESFVDIPAC
jgi:hypothetical protein